jgi:DNA-binding ferritin-like protein
MHIEMWQYWLESVLHTRDLHWHVSIYDFFAIHNATRGGQQT